MIKITNVTKSFGTGATGLVDVSLNIEKGEFVFLVGQTGSGKTTLLRLLIRDLLPTNGNIVIGDWDLGKLPKGKIPHLRKKIGVIFQDLKLLVDRTILENVLLPLEFINTDLVVAKKRAEEILSQVGVLMHKDKFPIQLSGGELQRVAIARALILSPEILLADEPTGNLDNTTAFEIIDLLSRINNSGTIVIMATHNMDIVKALNKRTVTLEKGHILHDEHKEKKGEVKKHAA